MSECDSRASGVLPASVACLARYYFKKVSDEFDCGVVFEEVREDDAILPIFEEKIIGKVEKIDWPAYVEMEGADETDGRTDVWSVLGERGGKGNDALTGLKRNKPTVATGTRRQKHSPSLLRSLT